MRSKFSASSWSSNILLRGEVCVRTRVFLDPCHWQWLHIVVVLDLRRQSMMLVYLVTGGESLVELSTSPCSVVDAGIGLGNKWSFVNSGKTTWRSNANCRKTEH